MSSDARYVQALAGVVGRRRLLQGAAAAGAVMLIQPLLTACGASGSTAVPANDGGAASSASQALLQGALSRAVQGDWKVYHWQSQSADGLPDWAAPYGISDPLDMARAFAGEKVDPQSTLTIGDGTYTLTGGIDDFSLWNQIGRKDTMSGTWRIDNGILTASVPLVEQTQYYSSSPTAAGVPDPLSGSDNGSVKWEFYKGAPDSVSYRVSKDKVYLNTPSPGTAWSYGLLAVRA